VIFEVLKAVSVKRAVVLGVTPCRLIEIYHPFFFYDEVRGGRFLHLHGRNRASCFLQNIFKIPISKDEILEELSNCVTDVQQHVAFSTLMDEWDSVVPLNVHVFHPRGKSAKWEFKVNSAQLQQKPSIAKAIC